MLLRTLTIVFLLTAMFSFCVAIFGNMSDSDKLSIFIVSYICLLITAAYLVIKRD